MSYYRRSDEPDAFEKQAEAARKYADERAKQKAENEARLAATGSTAQMNPLYLIVHGPSDSHADDALMQSNPAKYIKLKYAPFFDKIGAIYKELLMHPSYDTMQAILKELRETSEKVQWGDKKELYNVFKLRQWLSGITGKDSYKLFKKYWERNSPAGSFEQSLGACLKDLETIHTQMCNYR